jgi:hypothetical protein
MEFTTTDIEEFQRMIKMAIMDGLMFKSYSTPSQYVIEYTGGY